MSVNLPELQPAYILHHRNFRETSLIIEAFSLQAGRIDMVARGARKSRPDTRVLFQPFRPLMLSWVGSRGLRTLSRIEAAGTPVKLIDNSLACGYYVNELTLRLVGPEQAQTTLFAFYTQALSQLANPDVDYESTIRLFELQLLDALGVLPDLHRCGVDGAEIDPSNDYLFYPTSNVAAIVNAGTRSQVSEPQAALYPDGITLEDGVPVKGSTLLALSQFDVDDPDVREDARLLMRHLLRVQLGDRPLKSREFFKAMQSRTTDSR